MHIHICMEYGVQYTLSTRKSIIPSRSILVNAQPLAPGSCSKNISDPEISRLIGLSWAPGQAAGYQNPVSDWFQQTLLLLQAPQGRWARCIDLQLFRASIGLQVETDKSAQRRSK